MRDATMFRMTRSSNTTGITQMGEVEVAPAHIVRRFGPPSPGDSYKVSGEYVFLDSNGEPFVVHDWKVTSLWDKQFQNPQDFWMSAEATELSISSRDKDIEEFKRWFLQELATV